MAANEFRTLANLQPPSVEQLSPFVSKLLGGFQATEGLTAGEQWLVFRFDGTTSAADYAAVRVERAKGRDKEVWTRTRPASPHTPPLVAAGTERVGGEVWRCAGGGSGHPRGPMCGQRGFL
jgi:hypothetical protein